MDKLTQDTGGTIEEGEALQQTLDLAFPQRHEVRADALAWRGRRGSKLIPNGRDWFFKPGKNMRTNTPGGAWVPLRESFSKCGITRVAEKLDAECAPHWVTQDQLERFLALRRIVGSVWRSARKRAAEADLPFKLTLFDAERLLEDQKMVCAVSGLPFSEAAAGEGSFRSPLRPSLDRIVNAKGYALGNVRLVLTLVNLAMNDWGSKPLIEVARAIAAKHPAAAPAAATVSE